MNARGSALSTTGAVAVYALLSFGCRGEATIATGLTDGALMSLRAGISAGEVRTVLGQPLEVVVREPAEELLFECSELGCPTTPDRGRLRYLLERQRGR